MTLRLAFLVFILLTALTAAPFYRTPCKRSANTPLAALGQISAAEDLSTIQVDVAHRNGADQLAAAPERRLQARLATITGSDKEQEL